MIDAATGGEVFSEFTGALRGLTAEVLTLLRQRAC